jgi:hypothetical protein
MSDATLSVGEPSGEQVTSTVTRPKVMAEAIKPPDNADQEQTVKAHPKTEDSRPLLSGFFTKEELARELLRNPRSLDRWAVLGTGPPRTLIGRKVLYNRASVRRWIAAQEQSRAATRERRDLP